MPHLFCDLDGTLNNYDRILYDESQGRLINDTFHLSYIGRALPLPNSREALAAFAKNDWDITILTSRGFRDAEYVTKKWLILHDYYYHNIHCVDDMGKKPGVLYVRQPSLFIDDFMAGQETDNPTFLSRIYEACRDTNVPIEVFRHNWPEIIQRRLGVRL